MRVERTFAWEDKFKRLLLRFERIQQRHYGMKLMAYTLINYERSAVSETRNQLMGNQGFRRTRKLHIPPNYVVSPDTLRDPLVVVQFHPSLGHQLHQPSDLR